MPWPWRYMAPSIVPLMRCSCPVPFAKKTPLKHNVSTSIFDGGDGVLGFTGSITPPPSTASWVDAKELDFGLIWPQHLTQFSSESLANFRRACCTYAFLNRETLQALQDFSFYGIVLLVVFLGTMVPAALRSLIRCFSVIPGWFLSILVIIETPQGEISHGAPDRGRLTVILCFLHLRIIAPTVITFSLSCLAMVL